MPPPLVTLLLATLMPPMQGLATHIRNGAASTSHFRADIEGRSSEIYPKSKADAGMRILGNQTTETLTWPLTAVQTLSWDGHPYHRRVSNPDLL